MKISVAMCTFNGARYLREQLDSIANQTGPPDELVICDDNSVDGTCEIVRSFASSASFPVRLHVNQQNLGSTKNFERAITVCEGDVIVLSDQDDVWLPHKLKEIEKSFSHNPSLGLVFSDAEVVDENLRPLGRGLWESVGFDDSHRQLVRAGRALDVLLPGWTVTGATMAFRADFKRFALDIPPNIPIIHDGWIALMIASVADVAFIEERLIKYRQHPGQQIGAREKMVDHGDRGILGVKKAMRRTNSFQVMIEIGTLAQRRLLECKDVYDSHNARHRLEARLKHLRARANLPNRKLDRARCVIGELLSRRYHLYSNGFRSAVKDLIG